MRSAGFGKRFKVKTAGMDHVQKLSGALSQRKCPADGAASYATTKNLPRRERSKLRHHQHQFRPEAERAQQCCAPTKNLVECNF